MSVASIIKQKILLSYYIFSGFTKNAKKILKQILSFVYQLFGIRERCNYGKKMVIKEVVIKKNRNEMKFSQMLNQLQAPIYYERHVHHQKCLLTLAGLFVSTSFDLLQTKKLISLYCKYQISCDAKICQQLGPHFFISSQYLCWLKLLYNQQNQIRSLGYHKQS